MHGRGHIEPNGLARVAGAWRPDLACLRANAVDRRETSLMSHGPFYRSIGVVQLACWEESTRVPTLSQPWDQQRTQAALICQGADDWDDLEARV